MCGVRCVYSIMHLDRGFTGASLLGELVLGIWRAGGSRTTYEHCA